MLIDFSPAIAISNLTFLAVLQGNRLQKASTEELIALETRDQDVTLIESLTSDLLAKMNLHSREQILSIVETPMFVVPMVFLDEPAWET